MSQTIASWRGDTKPLALSSSSFLNNWKGQRKRTLIGLRKEKKKQTPPMVWSISHVACVQTPLHSGKIGFFPRGDGVCCERRELLGARSNWGHAVET